MTRRTTSRLALSPVATALLGLAASLAAPVHAADFKAGDWDMSLGGIVNAYYTTASCSGDQTITGLALAGQALGCGGKDHATTIGNGLLPNVISVGAKTRQEGIDIGVTMMVGSAVSSSDAIGNNNNVDIRQGFMTFGNADMGTFKLGRDYGLFGSTAILSDMTLLGAGAPVNATQANRVTLGHIGAGYSYLGHYGQIAYTLPNTGAFSLSAALMSPVNPFANTTAVAGKTPQIQALASVKVADGKFWVGGKSQKFDGVASHADDFTMSGVEVGGSYTLGTVSVLANLQSGKGLGVLADGDNGDHKQTNTLAQVTWQATPKAKLGLSWGRTKLKDAVTTDLESNTNATLGLYYGLTKSLTLVAEGSSTKSKAANGDEAKMNGVALGGILFF
jgi:predicted porin